MLHADIAATSVYVTHDQEEAMSLSDMIAVMSSGHLEQYGSPEEIYATPATQFVAGFVGKPRMNLFTATPVERGRYTLEGSSFIIDADGGSAGEGAVRMGLRPSECSARRCNAEDAEGVVAVVEPLGSHTDVIIDISGYEFVVREAGFTSLKAGDPVCIITDGAARHVFDINSGFRL